MRLYSCFLLFRFVPYTCIQNKPIIVWNRAKPPQVRRFRDSLSPLDAVFIQQKRNDAHVLDPAVIHVQSGAARGDDDFFEEIPAL